MRRTTLMASLWLLPLVAALAGAPASAATSSCVPTPDDSQVKVTLRSRATLGEVAPPAELTSEAIGRAISRTGPKRYAIRRELVHGLLSNPTLLRQARLVPSIRDGRPDGLRLFAIRPGSVFSLIGFENGDTIRTINGFELTHPDKALEAYTRLRNASQLSVGLLRRGQPLTLEYTIR